MATTSPKSPLLCPKCGYDLPFRKSHDAELKTSVFSCWRCGHVFEAHDETTPLPMPRINLDAS